MAHQPIRSGKQGASTITIPVSKSFRFHQWLNWHTYGLRERALRLSFWQLLGVSIVFTLLFCAGPVVLWNLAQERMQAEQTAPFGPYLQEYLATPGQTQQGAYIRGKVVTVDTFNKKIDPLYFDLPADLRASTPAEVGTIVWMHRQASQVGYYTKGGGAHQWRCDLKVIDRTTSTLLAEKTFWGSDPPRSKTDSGDAYGSFPSGEIIGYLSGLPRK